MNLTILPLLVALLLLVIVAPLQALIMVGGKEPVRDNNWPAGSLEVANLKTRVGWWEGPPFGGGQYNFLYRGETNAFQEALDLFAKIKAPKLVLVVQDGGPAQSPFLRDGKDPKSSNAYDWSFTVWNPQNFNHLYNTPESFFSARDPSGRFGQPVDPPQIDVFVDKGGGIDFAKIKVPANLTVTDERADAAHIAGGSAVIGDVYDVSTSKPVAGATVAVQRTGAQGQWETLASGDADAAGHIQMTKVPAGSCRVIVTAKAYATRLLGYAEFRGNTLKRYTAELSTTAALRGTVADTDGKPVAGVNVRVDSIIGPDGRGYLLPDPLQATTNNQGEFELTRLPHGHAQIFAYGNHYQMLDVLKLYTIPEDHLELRLTATGTIKGRVLAKDGKPATTGNIEVEPEGGSKLGSWGGSSNTKPDGSFVFENVPPGTYVLSAMATNPGPARQGRDPNLKKVVVKAGQTVEVDVTGR
jgi:hypothetical protein